VKAHEKENGKYKCADGYAQNAIKRLAVLLYPFDTDNENVFEFISF